MEGLKIDHELVEIEMYSVDSGILLDMYDEYNDNYMSITLSNDELSKIREYINTVLCDSGIQAAFYCMKSGERL